LLALSQQRRKASPKEYGVPDLRREGAGEQQVVRVLGVLVAKGAVVGLLEAMSHAAFRGPQTSMEGNPEEELHFVWAADSPELLGSSDCDASLEKKHGRPRRWSTRRP